MVEAIRQGRCTACDESDDNYSIENRSMDSLEHETEDAVTITPRLLYLARCECGSKAAVAITDESLQTDGTISLDEASWNQSEEGDE